MRTLLEIYNQGATTQASVNNLQDDARTPISSAPFTISGSGSYYLTGNLTVTSGNGITITADDVTLDLNGFTISSTASPASSNGVLISDARKNITIRNGHIRGTTTYVAPTFTGGGFLDGIDTTSSASANISISDVNVLGVGADGINLTSSSIPGYSVQRCKVTVCGGTGVLAGNVRDCVVMTAGSVGINSNAVSNSYGESVSGPSANVLQNDPRTPISSLPFTISAAGSYYLTGNLALTTGTGITISADQVTLDLNGFALSSTASPASGTAVSISGTRRNITIKHGHIRGTTTFSAGTFTTGGFLDGINSTSSLSANIRISDVNVYGIADDGIQSVALIDSFFVERCIASVCGGNGILAGVVRECTADATGATAITGNHVSNSAGESVGTGTTDDGVRATFIVENCRGVAVAGSGVECPGQTNNSSGISDSGIGLNASGGSVQNSRGTSSSNAGVWADIASNCAGVSTSSFGLDAASATNCEGTSSTGIALTATNATNCVGTSANGAIGLYASGTASFCRGSRSGGTALSAGIAIGCNVFSGTINSSNKFLGTP